MSKHYFEGIKDNSHQNIIFLKLKLNYQPNRTINSIKFEIELLFNKIGKAKLSLMK
jgi:hypothetical protein